VLENEWERNVWERVGRCDWGKMGRRIDKTGAIVGDFGFSIVFSMVVVGGRWGRGIVVVSGV
jgi:hypothetical protein